VPYVNAPVSIHAPVTGATALEARGALGAGVSIHAPVTGATAFGLLAALVVMFQSTRP